MPNKNEISLELLELTEKEIDLENIMVDPNNPRLLEMGFQVVPDERISEVEVQKEAIANMKKSGLKDIIEKVKKFGFLTVDRVVVRPLRNDKYIVVEGNRRISSLKVLHEDHTRGRISLDGRVVGSLKKFNVLAYEGENKDIVWLLQGIRHIKGIKEWGPLQQGKYFSDMQDQRGFMPTDLATMTGIGRKTVAGLIRSYKGWEQAKEDEDYGDKINADHFSLFNEAVFKKPILRNWLAWDDANRKFGNIDNFKKLLGWYLGDEGINSGQPRLPRVNPDVRDVLSNLLLEENKIIFEKFENGDISMDEARYKMDEAKYQKETQEVKVNLNTKLSDLDGMVATIQTLPIPKIIEAKEKMDSFIEKLENVENTAKTQKDILSTIKTQRSN